MRLSVFPSQRELHAALSKGTAGFQRIAPSYVAESHVFFFFFWRSYVCGAHRHGHLSRHWTSSFPLSCHFHQSFEMSETAEPTNRFAGNVRQAEVPSEKALRIKVNSLKRTIKDLEFAKREVSQELNRLDTMRNGDPDRIPQQEKVVDEARMMVPHSVNRIMVSVKDLSDYLEKEGSTVENEELVATAHAAIAEGQAAVS
ncbi:tubulin binding cofactor A-like protein [Novymonas esmeraldas]|uniref:Tubulin-specific chaperone A n=1 Tax=Novymonas esmeraldas TaxID=1808958 RepID=A0AAW0FCK5_9TRYP